MLARLRMSMGEIPFLVAPWGWWPSWKVSINEVKSSGNLSANSVKPSITSPISLSRSVTALILLTLTPAACLCWPSFLCRTCCLRIGWLCFWGDCLMKLRGGGEKRCLTCCWGGFGRKLLLSFTGALSGLWLAFGPEKVVYGRRLNNIHKVRSECLTYLILWTFLCCLNEAAHCSCLGGCL